MYLIVREAPSMDVTLLATEAMTGKMDNKMITENQLLNYSVMIVFFFFKRLQVSMIFFP